MNRTPVGDGRFAYLDDAAVQARLLDFTKEAMAGSPFTSRDPLPGLHLAAGKFIPAESGHRAGPGEFSPQGSGPDPSIRAASRCAGVVELLTSIGYEPTLNLGAGAPRAPACARSGACGSRSDWPASFPPTA
jgi:hypothetical protein